MAIPTISILVPRFSNSSPTRELIAPQPTNATFKQVTLFPFLVLGATGGIPNLAFVALSQIRDMRRQ